MELAPAGHRSLSGDLGLGGGAGERCWCWDSRAGGKGRRMPALARFRPEQLGCM